MKEIRLMGPLHSNSGYGKSGRALLAALVSAGWRVQALEVELRTIVQVSTHGPVTHRSVPMSASVVRPEVQEAELREAVATIVSPDAPTLIMHNPGGLSLHGAEFEGLRIGLTMLEADTLCPHWTWGLGNVDLMLAASKWNADVMRPHLPDYVPVETVGLCVDERLWSPEGPKREIADRPGFLFCSVFSTCERKGWRELIQAFAEEFRGEDAGLLLKPTRREEVRELADWARALGVWIGTVEGDLSDAEMAELYRACDCYALPSAEGFGVTFIEAALCGLPLIGLDAGGTGDFIAEATGVPLSASMEPCVGQLPHIYRAEYSWPTADVPEIRRALRQAFEEGVGGRGPGAGKGDAARQMALDRFSREAIGNAVGRIVEGELQGLPCPPAIPLHEELIPRAVAIVTTFNHLEQTQRCVAALQRWSPEIGIVLADDGSSDGTIEWARAAGIAIVECGHSGNVSANRQRAVDFVFIMAEGKAAGDKPPPYFVFFDNDTEVGEDWWPRLAAIFADRPDVGVLAPRKALRSGEVQNVGNRIVPDGHTGPLMLDRPIVWCDYVESAAMAVRPEVVTGQDWDPQFRIFYEDTDYCFQARAAGWKIAATAEVTVLHEAHTTSVAREGESDERRRAFLRKWKDQF